MEKPSLPIVNSPKSVTQLFKFFGKAVFTIPKILKHEGSGTSWLQTPSFEIS